MRACNQCETKMIEDCDVKVDGTAYGINIKQKRKGVFNNVSAKPKAAICPNCGNVTLYVDEFREFNQ